MFYNFDNSSKKCTYFQRIECKNNEKSVLIFLRCIISAGENFETIIKTHSMINHPE